jgi:hypothetical protein
VRYHVFACLRGKGGISDFKFSTPPLFSLRADWLITGGGGGDVRMVSVVGARHSIVGGIVLHNQTTSIILYFFFVYLEVLVTSQKSEISCICVLEGKGGN